MQQLAAKLREKGLKATPQRMAIYRMLSNTTAHPTAETVWEQVKGEFPAVSFNTVYTTLSAFEQVGLIQRLHIGGNIAHYDANVNPHIHLHCENCGRVDDHPGSFYIDFGSLSREIGEQAAYIVSRAELNLYGLCPHCRAQ